MALIYWGQVNAASDLTMSTIVETPGSRTRQAVIDLITPVAAGIISNNPTIIAAAESAAEAAVAGALDDAGLIVAIPTAPTRSSSRTSLPISWVQKAMYSAYANGYSATYDGTWNTSNDRYGKDIPLLTSTGKLDAGQIPDSIARKSDIPAPVDPGDGAANVLERAVSGRVPVFGARVAAAIIDAAPCAVVLAGSSTTSRMPGFAVRLAEAVQQAYHVSSPSTVQASNTATFTERTGPGIHFYNAGHSGMTAATYLTDEECDRIAALKPAVIQHMVGSNDFQLHRSAAEYKSLMLSRLAYLDSKLTTPCQTVLVQPYERMDVSSAVPPWSAYGQVLQEIADSRPDTIYVDISGHYEAVGIPISDPLNLIDPDNIHQTGRGNRFMADLLSAVYIA